MCPPAFEALGVGSDDLTLRTSCRLNAPSAIISFDSGRSCSLSFAAGSVYLHDMLSRLLPRDFRSHLGIGPVPGDSRNLLENFLRVAVEEDMHRSLLTATMREATP